MVPRHDVAKKYPDHVRVVEYRFGKRTATNALCRQFVTVCGRYGDRVQNRIDGDLFPFAKRKAKLLEGVFNLLTQKGIRARLLYDSRLGNALLVAVSA
ncbi:hypothetical protein AGQ47_24560 [Salmonella enterica subsp. enterica]|nr:hypothetical protein AGQ47_24560 [Salmonella enterica subsp. enterica]